MNPTVVILLSDKRSGSTMLQRALCKHSAIQTVFYSPHTYLETHHWLKSAVILNKHPRIFSGGKLYPGYGSSANARAYLIDCVKGNIPNYSIPADNEDLVFKSWDALCKKYAKPIFFEKSPQVIAHWSALSLMLKWMQQTSFQVKIIGLVRNPMSVQYSAFKLFHSLPQNRQFGWLDIHKNLLAFKSLIDADSFHLVRYEKIVEQPEARLKELCEFMGIDFDLTMVDEIHGNSLAKWQEDQFFNFTLDESVKQIAKEFGYKELDFFNPEKPSVPVMKKWAWYFSTRIKLLKARLRDRIIVPFFIHFGLRKK